MNRYYDLDENGKVRGSFALPQPGMELVLLNDPPGDDYVWTGQEWTADVDAMKAKKLSLIRAGAATVILAKYPDWVQRNVALGLYPEVVGDAMKAAIGSVIAESNRCEDLVELATTAEEIDAVSPAWPVG